MYLNKKLINSAIEFCHRNPARFLNAPRSTAYQVLAAAALVCTLLACPTKAQSLEKVSCSGSTLVPPGSVPCSVMLTGSAPTGGFFVQLDTNSPVLSAPAAVTVEAGTSVAAFSLNGSEVASEESATLTAIAGSKQSSITVSLIAPTSPLQLIAKNSGKCLDVRGISTSPGAVVQQWSCWGNANQKWQITPAGNGTYELKSVNSGLALNVSDASQSAGAAIVQWPYSGASNQKWKLQPLGDGYYTVVSEGSGKCLDVSGGPNATGNGTAIQQWSCTGESNQAWQLVLNHSVTLTWNASPSPDVIGYYVYRSTSDSGPYTRLSSALVGSDYTDGSVQSGATYYYATTALNASKEESGYSNQAKAVIPKP